MLISLITLRLLSGKVLNKTLLIRTWVGDLPEWYLKWEVHAKKWKGFDYLVVNDYDFLKKRIKDKLGCELVDEVARYYISDFDPTFGVLFEEEIGGYDFWGHINLDCVYGRLHRYMTDEFLDDVDIFGNDPDAINGAFSLYRNVEKVNKLFYRVPFWKEILEIPKLMAFDEIHITKLLRTTDDIRFKSGYLQENDKQSDHIPTPQVRLKDDGTLINTKTGNEMMMFHFNRTREWTY